MSASVSSPIAPSLALSRFAKATVFATFALILLGGMVTTFGAGMAVPTWPTIHGEMNPAGWWQEHHVLLEHSHRLTAIAVGLLTGILCAWVWGNGQALLWAVIASGLADAIGRASHLDGNFLAQLRFWCSVLVFIAALFLRHRGPLTANHWLALAAYLAVCVQAVLGGLRVTQETAGALDTAMLLRVVHGCFAHVFLALLVVLAARLSPRWQQIAPEPHAAKVRRFAGFAIGLYFAQLIVGAAMRHPGAGLAIATWPKIGDAWLPAQWSTFITLNFLHTRVIAFLLFGHVLGLTPRVLRCTPALRWPGLLLAALVILQVVLGIGVVQMGKSPQITTAHVFNGAAILAAAVLLMTRAGRADGSSPRAPSLSHQIAEAAA